MIFELTLQKQLKKKKLVLFTVIRKFNNNGGIVFKENDRIIRDQNEMAVKAELHGTTLSHTTS